MFCGAWEKHTEQEFEISRFSCYDSGVGLGCKSLKDEVATMASPDLCSVNKNVHRIFDKVLHVSSLKKWEQTIDIK